MMIVTVQCCMVSEARNVWWLLSGQNFLDRNVTANVAFVICLLLTLCDS